MKRLMLMSVLIVVVTGVQAAKQYRDFTSTEGKTIRGCIVTYDVTKEIVTIERDNQKVAKVPIGIFSGDDQAYIRDWEIARNFAQERVFKVSAKRIRIANELKSSSSVSRTTKVEDTYYELQLENRSASEMKNLEFEYCIFYEQEEIAAGPRQVCSQGVYCGKLPDSSLAAREKKTIETEEVSIYKMELNSDYIYGSSSDGAAGIDNVQQGEIHGLWIRVHLKLPSGFKETREFCFPDSLNNGKVWATASIPAGVNVVEANNKKKK